MISNVIRAAMSVQNVKRAELAEKLNMKPTALANKMARGSFSADDCIRVAEALGLRLAFVDDTGRAVVGFSIDDAAPPRRSGQRIAEE